MPLGGGGDGEEIYKSMQGSILSNLINKITVTQSITNLIVFLNAYINTKNSNNRYVSATLCN